MNAERVLIATPRRVEFAIIGVACAVLGLLVKVWLRPQYGWDGDAVGFLLGVAPNFLYSIGLPFLALAAFQGGIGAGRAMAGAAGMILYEFEQLASSRRTFDPWDIVATILGAGLFYAYYRARR